MNSMWRTAFLMVISILVPLLIQLVDTRLSATVRRRAWNGATWGSALYAFGPLSMLGWCWCTRPRWTRVLVAGVMTALTFGLVLALDGAFVTFFPAKELDSWSDRALQAGAAGVGALVLLTVFELVAWLRRKIFAPRPVPYAFERPQGGGR